MNKKIAFCILAASAILIVGAGTFVYYKHVAVTGEAETATLPSLGATVDATLQAPMFSPKVSDENGITVTVTPLLVSSDVAVWDFDVVLSTHTQELGGYDLVQSATLVDDTGKVYRPIAWKPDATEGHHIGGALKFRAIGLNAKYVTLKISGIGSTSDRIFQWDAK